MGLEAKIELQDIVLSLLLGLYVVYAIRLVSAFRGVWCRISNVDKTSLNLLAMGLVAVFWPCLLCPCYLELLASSQFSGAHLEETKCSDTP